MLLKINLHINEPLYYDVGCGGLLWARKSRATFWSQSAPAGHTLERSSPVVKESGQVERLQVQPPD